MDAHNFIEEPRFPKLISDILGTKFTKKEERNWSYQDGNGAGKVRFDIPHSRFQILVYLPFLLSNLINWQGINLSHDPCHLTERVARKLWKLYHLRKFWLTNASQQEAIHWHLAMSRDLFCWSECHCTFLNKVQLSSGAYYNYSPFACQSGCQTRGLVAFSFRHG